MTMTREKTANGSEAWWARTAQTLESLITRDLPPGITVEIGVGDGTTWHEPGTERHERPYWFLGLTVTPYERAYVVWTRLEALGLLGQVMDPESWDWVLRDGRGPVESAGRYAISDFCAGLSQGQMRRLLHRAEALSR